MPQFSHINSGEKMRAKGVRQVEREISGHVI